MLTLTLLPKTHSLRHIHADLNHESKPRHPKTHTMRFPLSIAHCPFSFVLPVHSRSVFTGNRKARSKDQPHFRKSRNKKQKRKKRLKHRHAYTHAHGLRVLVRDFSPPSLPVKRTEKAKRYTNRSQWKKGRFNDKRRKEKKRRNKGWVGIIVWYMKEGEEKGGSLAFLLVRLRACARFLRGKNKIPKRGGKRQRVNCCLVESGHFE